jgi:hypothetical protein
MSGEAIRVTTIQRRRKIMARILAAMGLVICACAAQAMQKNGEVWHDTAGHVVNAHGGGVLAHGGKYYLYGEHKVYGRAGNKAHVGVHMYSSDDLESWKDEGAVNPANGLGPELTWGGQSNYILKKSEDEYIAMFDIWKPENQVDSRLVWLPVTFNSDGTISIKWK